MKTIKFFLIPLIILSAMAFSFVGRQVSTHTILIKSTGKDVTSATLSGAGGIISKRLKTFSKSEFEVSVLEKEKQIRVTLKGDWNLQAVDKLLVHKGVIGFYETYTKDDLTGLLKGDKKIFEMLTPGVPDNGGTKIGCTTAEGSGKVNDYLKTFDLGGKCKFLWDQDRDKPEVCLYALRLTGGEGPVITSGQIESAGCNKDVIDIKLNQEGAGKFAAATRRNLNKVIAIVLDDKVLSAPTVRSEIASGKIEITGKYSQDEAAYIAAVINGGVLPVTLEITK